MTPPTSSRLRIGPVWIDALTFEGALDRIDELVAQGEGGSVFTPNVDHVVNADRMPALREAYAAASLSLVDGQPLVWASRLLGTRLPEKISGSDLVPRVLERAAEQRLRVYLLGGAPGVAREACDLLRARGVEVVGIDDGRIPLEASSQDDAVVDRIRAARPNLLLVALGCPKQELWIHRCGARVKPAVCLAVGAALDFVTGRVERAPLWMQRAGLEWLHRLGQEPRRLAWRYFVNDPWFLVVMARTLAMAREERIAQPRGHSRASSDRPV